MSLHQSRLLFNPQHFIVVRKPRPAFLLLVMGLITITFLAALHYRSLRTYFSTKKNPSRDLLFASVARGQQQKLVLPDGSTVWLNATSFLSYPRNMRRDGRTVELHGEGFFDVVSEPDQPFKVIARDMTVEVLGTQFNVRDYPDETLTQTVVKDGAVKVLSNNEETVLHPGEAAEIDGSGRKNPITMRHINVDAGSLTDWTKGYIKFDGVDLATLIRELRRAYAVDIDLQGDLPGAIFYGSFSRKLPIERVLKLLNWHEHAVEISVINQQKLILRIVAK